MNRAVGLSEVTAVADGEEVSSLNVTVRTVAKLHHTIPSGDDPYEVPSYSVFGRVEQGEVALLSSAEVRLLYKHLENHIPNLSVLGWVPVESESSSELSVAFDPILSTDSRSRVLREIAQRQGQGEFRSALLAAYRGRCCVSGCGVAAVLEAAHIIPYQGQTTNHVQNGLLLRADLHTLFDLNLLRIDPGTFRVTIDDSVRDTDYSRWNGVVLTLPASSSSRPSAEALRRRQSLLAHLSE